MMKIWIVDDDQASLAALRMMLQHEDHTVQEFSAAKALLEQLSREELPDLILTDLFMPVIDGLELLADLRQNFPELPVTMVTSSRDLQLTVKAINLGVYGFLLKPVVMEELLMMVQRLERELGLRRRVAEEQERLVHAQRLAGIGTLASGMAHEINNPNSFIRGNIDILDKLWKRILPILENGADAASRDLLRFVKEEVPQILDGVRNGSDRITQIVNSLSLYTRETRDLSGKGDFRAAISQAQVILNNKLGVIAVSVVDEAPGLANVTAPEIHLEQMLINLLSNAADAVSQSPRPRITIRIQSINGSCVGIDIIDNGTGIDEAALGSLKTPFFTTKNQGEGTGLGLHVTHQLVTRAGGTLTYVNNPQGGATFSLALPIAQYEPRQGSAA